MVDICSHGPSLFIVDIVCIGYAFLCITYVVWQIEKVESELLRSKSLRERQSRDFERQRDELLRTHAKQLAELKLATELEQAHLIDDFHAQMQLHRGQKEKELSELRQTLLADATDIERRAKEKAESDAKVEHRQLRSQY